MCCCSTRGRSGRWRTHGSGVFCKCTQPLLVLTQFKNSLSMAVCVCVCVCCVCVHVCEFVCMMYGHMDVCVLYLCICQQLTAPCRILIELPVISELLKSSVSEGYDLH